MARARKLEIREPAEWLAAILHDRGWNQAKLARELKTDNGTVSRWLSGDCRPSLGMAIELDELVGLPVYAWKEHHAP